MHNMVREEEFSKTIEENKGLIFKVANSYCRHEEDRKDLVQEISIQIWKSFNKYNKQYKLSTWIYRISLNVAISYYRKNKIRKEQITPLSEETIHITDQENTDGGEIARLYAFIHELKELDRALMLLYLDNSSYKEISEILGISESNVATKINRIKKKLKQRFDNFKN